MKGKVIGIGGIFFKSKSPEDLKKWYADCLNIHTDQWGASFISKKYSKSEENAYLQWSVFPQDTTYFNPSDQPFMINYRVEDMEALIDALRLKGVTICDEIEEFDYGKFVHILDSEGNKIELWEPKDGVFDKMYKDTMKLNHE